MNGQFTKGHKPWNKDKKRPEMSGEKHPMFGKKHTDASKQKNRETVKRGYQNGRIVWNKNRPWTRAEKEKISRGKKGKPINSPTKFKKGQKSLFKGKNAYWIMGEKNGNWKGGIMPINTKIRQSLEYKLWSDSVWNRDGNCCQKCGDNRISRLVSHHIRNFAQVVELRFAIDNGITFCRDCHKKFHHLFGKKNNNLEQVNKFIAN